MVHHIKNNKLLLSVLVIAELFILAIFLYLPQQDNSSVLAKKTVIVEKVFTSQELSKYDGTDPSLPIYLALDGDVYDVSPGKEYYKLGGSYHILAGKDASEQLHFAGGSIIKRKYKIVGKLF